MLRRLRMPIIARTRADRQWRIAPLVAACVLSGVSCDGRDDSNAIVEDDSSTGEAPRDGRVVLFTIDGVRWQDVFLGSNEAWSGEAALPPEATMPRLHALVASRGLVLGAPLDGCGTVHTAGGTNMSFPGYLEIFTGHPSHCLDNDCSPPTETVLDEAARHLQLPVASVGSWDVLGSAVTNGRNGVYVSAGQGGAGGDPYPGHDDYRPDAATAPMALDYYVQHTPVLMHVGLGDTDELGHRNDYPAYLVALNDSDTLIGRFADAIDAMGAAGEKITVIVTPDHGRNSDFTNHGTLRPESGRTFIAAFGARVPHRGIACLQGDVTLADIAPTIRVLMGLPRDIGAGAGQPIRLITEPD
jgi:hypothetical protein